MEIRILICLLSCCTASCGNGDCSSPAVRECLGDRNYCGSLSGPGGRYELSCEENQCRCPESEFYDYCTCLPHVGSCLIEKDSGSSIGTPSTRGDSETTYSCIASDNCNYDVHVIGNYESSNGRHGIGIPREAGDTHVQMTVSGQSSRPIILVLVSYEPVNWRLSVTGAAVIDRVILSGYYSSTVSPTSGSTFREIEMLNSPDNPSGYGSDIGGGDTAELLHYLQLRFGPASSFSGSYRADRWELSVQRTTDECSGYCCSTGHCVEYIGDCKLYEAATEAASEDDSASTSNGVLIGVPLSVAITCVACILLVISGICFRKYRVKQRNQRPSAPPATDTSTLELQSVTIITSVDDQQRSSEVTAASDQPPQYSQSALFSSVEPPPSYCYTYRNLNNV